MKGYCYDTPAWMSSYPPPFPHDWIMHRLHEEMLAAWAVLTHFILTSCHDGAVTNLHLLCHARNSFFFPINITSDFSIRQCIATLRNTPHLSWLWSTLPPLVAPAHKLVVTYKLPPAIHIRSLWVAPAAACYVTGQSEREPLDMPCMCNDDALALKTFCHPGHMGVLLFINSKGFQLGICGRPLSSLRV